MAFHGRTEDTEASASAWSPLYANNFAPATRALAARTPLRVAAVIEAPWVTLDDSGAPVGIEADAVRRYCAWRGRDVSFELCDRKTLAARLQDGSIDLAIGGIAETPWLACVAHLATFSPRMLRLGDAPRRHVWAVARSTGTERLRIRQFLLALKHADG